MLSMTESDWLRNRELARVFPQLPHLASANERTVVVDRVL